MRHGVKELVIYSMVGIMQVGFGASIVSASAPIDNDSQQVVQLSDSRHDRNNDRHDEHQRDRDRQRERDQQERRREHDRRLREENERHEREMRRHRGESEREWHERQERERRRHDDALRDIAAILIGIILGSSGD